MEAEQSLGNHQHVREEQKGWSLRSLRKENMGAPPENQGRKGLPKGIGFPSQQEWALETSSGEGKEREGG